MTPPDETGAPKRFITTTVEIEGRVESKVVEVPQHEPPAWEAGESLRIVGQPIVRQDAREKVTGRARYTADIQRPGMLHAAFVRIPAARATVTALDTAPAFGIPGVVDVITATELPRAIKTGGVSLFEREIRFPGQPIAAVCAESREAAERGAAAVRVTWETLPAVTTVAQALADGAPAVRSSGNVMRGSPQVVERGDVDAALRSADVVVRREYRTSSQLHSCMEPHGAVAEWDGDQVTIWESTQGIFRVRDEVANALGLARSRVRVIKDYMGGGFGSKTHAGAHTFAAVVLARRTGRAVRCVLDREGEQVSTGHRPASRQSVTLGAMRDGRLVAIDAECEFALGIAGWDASVAAMMRELYACDNVRTRETIAFSNEQEMQAFRAPGHVEGAFGLERAMDELARALALDPLELRLRNVPDRDQDKDRPYTGSHLRECLVEGARRFAWGTPTTPSRPGTLRGAGIAAQVWGAGGGPPAYASVRLNSDGTIDVLSGTQDLGTGSRTILAQIAAEALGAKLEHVRVVLGDTERTPYAGTSWGSMTTASVGPAVRSGADEARRHLLEAASELLECHVDDLVARDSVVTTRDNARRLTFAEITRKLGNVMIMGHGSRGPNPQGVGIASFGAQFAEVEVDPSTGVVRVLRLVAVHDVGRVINPLLASSQLEGGIIQGLGFALFEERRLDPRTGRPLNPSLHDYKIPTIADIPAIDASCLDTVDTAANHIGARGLAEPPIIPTAPAIANAVAAALGVDVGELPMTPAVVLGAIGGGRLS